MGEGKTELPTEESLEGHTLKLCAFSRKCKNFVVKLLQTYFTSVTGKRHRVPLGSKSSQPHLSYTKESHQISMNKKKYGCKSVAHKIVTLW